MSDEILQRYVELRLQMRKLKAEAEALRGEVFDLVQERGGTANVEGTQLLIRSRRQWEYSEVVEYLSAELNEKRASEKADGTATVARTTEYLMARLTQEPEDATEPEDTASQLDQIRREHPRAYRSWDRAEEEVVLREFDNGASVSEIAELLERQPSAIISRLQSLDVLD